MIEIVNVVTLWDLGCKSAINLVNRNYKKKYNAEVRNTTDGCLLIFQSGKIIATGFKSVEKALALKLAFRNSLRKK